MSTELQSVNILPVPADMLAEAWPMVAPHFVRGVIAMNGNLAECMKRVETGEFALWMAIVGNPPALKGAFVTELCFDDYDRKFIGVAALGGTDFRAWKSALDDTMQEHARKMGCASVRFIGRKAYKRLFSNLRVVESAPDGHVYERAVL